MHVHVFDLGRRPMNLFILSHRIILKWVGQDVILKSQIGLT